MQVCWFQDVSGRFKMFQYVRCNSGSPEDCWVFEPWRGCVCTCVSIIPASCDGCRGDRRGRVCRGSSYPFGTFPGLWASPTTGSQSCHLQEVWHPHIHTSQGITSLGGFQVKKIHSLSSSLWDLWPIRQLMLKDLFKSSVYTNKRTFCAYIVMPQMIFSCFNEASCFNNVLITQIIIIIT